MRNKAGGFWLAIILFASICFFYAAMKITWKYNGMAIAARVDRLEKQIELVREIIKVNGMLPADSEMQREWDKTFVDGRK